jgi:hypothetical protein
MIFPMLLIVTTKFIKAERVGQFEKQLQQMKIAQIFNKDYWQIQTSGI